MPTVATGKGGWRPQLATGSSHPNAHLAKKGLSSLNTLAANSLTPAAVGGFRRVWAAGQGQAVRRLELGVGVRAVTLYFLLGLQPRVSTSPGPQGSPPHSPLTLS